MALEYYDDAIIAKLKKWTPSNITLRVLKQDESDRLIETQADDTKDSNLKLPLVALSRNNDIELLLNTKNPRSFDGLKLAQNESQTLQLNVIPAKLQYQLDIYTKKQSEASEYLRQYLFKLINNPVIKIVIPYNNQEITQIANIRVLNTVSDTSDIPQRHFKGQFTRWTIQMEIQDAFFYDIPYRRNWKIYIDDGTILDADEMNVSNYAELEIAHNLTDKEPEEAEKLPIWFSK